MRSACRLWSKRSPKGAHQLVETRFAGVAEGRMADVMRQRQGLGEIGIQSQRGRDGAGDLGHFDGVRQAVAEMIGIARGEDLGFGFEAAKGARVDDAIAIARVIVSIGMRRLGPATAARPGDVHGVGAEPACRHFMRKKDARDRARFWCASGIRFQQAGATRNSTS